MRYRVLIVDDEPLACERLRALLREEPSVEIVCVCGSGTEAITMLRKTPVDLVFLDMEMPGCSGMEVLAQLPTKDRPLSFLPQLMNASRSTPLPRRQSITF